MEQGWPKEHLPIYINAVGHEVLRRVRRCSMYLTAGTDEATSSAAAKDVCLAPAELCTRLPLGRVEGVVVYEKYDFQ
jgi:hypothetical protein